MSAVYSYDAARRLSYMVERTTMALDIILKDIRPEVATVFSAYPFRTLGRSSSPPPLLAAWLRDSVSPSMVADHLMELDDSYSDSAWRKKEIKESAGTAFGGEQTPFSTVIVLMNFMLVMILHPDTQQKAQKLVDSVVGSKRLPAFHDRPTLHYIDAILRECMRGAQFSLLVPIMHAAVESDVYKGATVTPNVWAMCHNEDKYPNASEFNPDRFLNPDGTLTDDTVSFVWGFGRRICPGRHLAEASIWSAMVCVLAVFNFYRAKDETGREIEIEPRWHGRLTVQPTPFPCSITPRNAIMDVTALQHLIRVSV
ncbi:cytochrome P450 [Suillus bovinus]|uniref:cytochrome P450 n=1 Tax=Suillus bovinus TaxID=48563 RepID=UPI001B85D166|nr:cytochrome P450 [Suillus bovinus]KAG2153603.1 cytochrome P450 [Suillus bovinus]